MSNRSSGEGTIVQRSDGRWQASVQMDGKRRTVYGTTRKEAAGKLAALKEQAQGGALPDPGKRTVADLVALFLDTAAPNLKPRTVAVYQDISARHILPALGSVKLARLEPARLQRLYAALQKQGHHRSAQQVHNFLHRAFKMAVLWRLLPENPCDRVLRPSYQTERREVWTPEQLLAFMAGTEGHWLHPFWLVAIVSGCRSGELRALTWADVDLKAGTVAVTKTAEHINGTWTSTAPKTRAGARTISLPAEGVAALRRQRAQQNTWRLKAGRSWPGTELVFTGDTGLPLHRSVPTHALARECRRLGLPVVSVHGLRHLHASILLHQGLPLPDVARRLGHATAAITAQVYSHALAKDDSAATAAIGRAMAAGG